MPLKSPRSIVITGASGGLGQALVAAYAAPGVTILLVGRDAARLDAAAQVARKSGALAEILVCSVTDDRRLTAGLMGFDMRNPVDLLIVNAGVKTGNINGTEPPDQMERVVKVNLIGAIHTVQALLGQMLARGTGQIALVSSLAALSPHADLLSYTATKAGLRGYAGALRRAVGQMGVQVSVITPGFIDTPMTHRHHGPTPMIMPADKAARLIRRGLARGAPHITFPWQLALLVRLQNLLPARWSDRIDRSFRADIIPDRDEAPARD
jgi:short-subunit dehydrogenase